MGCHQESEPVVITGIGLVTSVGNDRESSWAAVQRGETRFRFLEGIPGIPDGEFVGATVDMDGVPEGRLKVIPLCEQAAGEAMSDGQIDWGEIDRDRFACAISAHMGDASWLAGELGRPDQVNPNWWLQFVPDSSCTHLAAKYDLRGPRLSHSTACASSLISVLTATRAIRDGQADIALAGGGDIIHPIFVAGFNRMRVLARDEIPRAACRPFDASRKGFVFGEGAAFFIVERLSHALRRNARIYAEISAARALSQAHHVTGLDAESNSLAHLISITLEQSRLSPADVGYINAHGTGTEQNDLAEAQGIRRAFGTAANGVCLSATKSILGHMINASGAAELAITALAMRDGFAPPTLNLHHPDPACNIDGVPLVGRDHQFQHAMKLSLAFGGHLVAVLLSRWNDPISGFQYPQVARAA